MFQSKRELFWSLWRTQSKATAASIVAGFIWIFGYCTVAALVCVLLQLDIRETPAWVGLLHAVLLLGGGFWLITWAYGRVYRILGLRCPHCSYHFKGRWRERNAQSTGRCPQCDGPLTKQVA